MSWNISNDGRITRLDNGPKRPWWWKDEPKDDTSGIQTQLGNASDTQPGTSTTPTADGNATARP